MSFADAGHRPHATHFKEEPENPILTGPEGITVTLDTWGPIANLFPTLYDMLQSNWGDEPSRASEFPDDWEMDPPEPTLDNITGWNRLAPAQQAYVESLFAGRTLPQAKELISFAFTIDGVSRTCTHQLVRTRIGAAFMQHGGRDNDWRHRPFRLPETINRAIKQEMDPDTPQQTCIENWQPIDDLIIGNDMWASWQLADVVRDHIATARHIYAALVDAGVPWQDARFLLPEGMTTYIHATYNYAALEGVLANRLEHVMQWEINCVAQLMLREIKMKCPPLLSKYLGSRSDKLGRAALAGLESWPPDGKYRNPYEKCRTCDHIHKEGADCLNPLVGGGLCFCESYKPVDALPRTHRPEQNPFWVLHPDSMAGGPIVWVPTDGTYPTEF